MVYGAIDLHTRYSQIRIVDPEGTVLRDQRALTTRGAPGGGLCGADPMRVLARGGDGE